MLPNERGGIKKKNTTGTPLSQFVTTPLTPNQTHNPNPNPKTNHTMKTKLLALITAALTFATPPAQGASDYLLEIDGIKGESTDTDHKDWIIIESFNWGVSNTTTSGGGAGKVSFSDISFTAVISKACPQLLAACATGQHIPKAKLVMRKQGYNSREYMVIELENLVISSHSVGSGTARPDPAAESAPSESFSLNFTKIKVTYREANGTTTTGSAALPTTP